MNDCHLGEIEDCKEDQKKEKKEKKKKPSRTMARTIEWLHATVPVCEPPPASARPSPPSLLSLTSLHARVPCLDSDGGHCTRGVMRGGPQKIETTG